MGDVYIVKIGNDNVESAVEKIFSMVNLNFIFPPTKVKSIGIKLNLCDYRTRESGATSDPIVVKAIIKTLRRLYGNVNIYLIENNASGTFISNLFPFLGFDKFEQEFECKLVDLSKEKWVKKKINGMFFKEIDVPEIINKIDIFINHPKMKTHSITKVTLGLKNLFGCLKPKHKAKYHKMLDEVIVDINLAIRSDLTLVDGNIALEGEGPTYGMPKKLGILIGGMDVVSVDACCARLMGFHPFWVGHIRKAAKAGIGSMKYTLYSDFNLKEEWKNMKFEFDYTRYLLRKFLRTFLNK